MGRNEREKKKEILKQFGVMEDRIKELEKELDICDDSILAELYKVEKRLLNQKLAQIEKAVMRLEDVNERRVLWLTYIGDIKNGKRKRLFLWQIANEMHYCEDWAKEKHVSALENIKFN